MKVHKNLFKTRPVTRTGGSFLAGISKCLDVKLQPLLKFLPSYSNDWEELLHDIRSIKKLPEGTTLFTADARSMYTEIDTEHRIEAVRNWIRKLMDEGNLEPD